MATLAKSIPEPGDGAGRAGEGARLAEARDSLAAGELELALAACREACERRLGPAHRALWEALRLAAIDAARERALAREEEGDREAAARWLGVLAREEPSRADSLVLHLERVRGAEEASPATKPRGGVQPLALAELVELRMDEVGSWLVARAGRVFVGGAEGVGGSEVQPGIWLEPVSSLTGGVRWHARASDGRLVVDGRAVDPPGAFAPPSARLRLEAPDGARFELRLERVGDDGSGAWLGFERGFGCRGTRGLLLLGTGTAAGVRFDRRASAPFGVRGLGESLELDLCEEAAEGARLVLRCAGGIRPASSLAAGEEGTTRLELPLPLQGRHDFLVGRDRPPLWCSWRPLGGTT